LKRRQKRFLKSMIGAEPRKQVIITSSKLRKAPSNDNIEFIPVERKARPIHSYR